MVGLFASIPVLGAGIRYIRKHSRFYCRPTDVWFHVDDLSSAHVYLRLERGPILKQFKETGRLDHIPNTLADCVQLVKANSIEGSKQSKVAVVFVMYMLLLLLSPCEDEI